MYKTKKAVHILGPIVPIMSEFFKVFAIFRITAQYSELETPFDIIKKPIAYACTPLDDYVLTRSKHIENVMLLE